jgi:hypothetical protein
MPMIFKRFREMRQMQLAGRWEKAPRTRKSGKALTTTFGLDRIRADVEDHIWKTLSR